MDVEERLQLTVRGVAEVVRLEELRELLETVKRPKAYWGFEPSGLMHIGTGLICGSKIADMIEAGFEFTVFLADWHAWINNKLGGDLEKIRVAGEYFKDCFKALGIDESRVRYIWASELVDDVEYWETVLRLGKLFSLRRVRRALPVLGRGMSDEIAETAWLIYPLMQAADIVKLRLDCVCAGMDQRKVHMLVREAAKKIEMKPPVCVHTPLLRGLKHVSMEGRFDEDERLDREIRTKMSKSIPDSCIFMHDSPEDVRRKLRAAYCPLRSVEDNPVMDMARLIVFRHMPELRVEREEKYGGSVTFSSYRELEKAYVNGKLHPLDLKMAVADALVEILRPVREYFERHPRNLERVLALEVTR